MKPFVLSLVVLCCCSCSLMTKNRFEDWSSFPSINEKEQRCIAKAIAEQQQGLNSYRALIDATISVGRAKYDLRQIAIFERPDNSRIEILQPGLNQTASIIVTRDGELVAYSALKKVGYRGQANIENYYRLLGIPMETGELMMWLSGVVITTGDVSIFRDPNSQAYLAVSRDGKREIRSEFEIVKGQVCSDPKVRTRSLEVAYDEDLLFSSSYKYGPNTEVPIESIKFYLEEIDLSGELKLEHIGKNFNLADRREKLFYFDLPGSATIKEIEDLNQDNILLPGN